MGGGYRGKKLKLGFLMIIVSCLSYIHDSVKVLSEQLPDTRVNIFIVDFNEDLTGPISIMLDRLNNIRKRIRAHHRGNDIVGTLSCHDMTCLAMPCHDMMYAMPCYDMTRHDITRHEMT